MIARPVVSNASPIIALDEIGRLSLMQQLFGTVLIPPAVAVEVAPSVTLPPWIEQRALTQAIGPMVLRASLGPGESETISLALEARAGLAILDDRPARRLALALSIPIIGTLGLLLAAKKRKLLPAIKPCLDDLVRRDFWITLNLYDQVLRDASEK